MSHSPAPPGSPLPPADLTDTGVHRYIHYGRATEQPYIRATKEFLLTAKQAPNPVAVLVCHGMGQQVRYQTISAVADAIRSEAIRNRGHASPVDVRLSEANDDFLPRAELAWVDENGDAHEVHVYEAYWAPLTEGKVSYLDTIKFLVCAALKGLRWSKPLMPSSFKRWMFGDAYDMPLGPATWIGLFIVLAFLLFQVGVIAYVSLALGQQWKQALAQPLPAFTGFWSWLGAMLHWVLALVPGVRATSNAPDWTVVIGWSMLLAEALFVRYFIVEFVGDVAAYISPYKDSKFDDLRHQIRKIGLNVGKVIYGFGEEQATIPAYEHIVMVGHSLGSVLAYDTLNSLIAADEVCEQADQRDVVRRTRALITFGSPLDKTAFIFRIQAKNDEQWIREKLAAAVQPLIVSYPRYRPKSFKWVNIWSPMDIISGSLEYYDRPGVASDHPQHVENILDAEAWVPFYAHVQYWGTRKLREQLYCYVTGTRCPKKVVAQASGT